MNKLILNTIGCFLFFLVLFSGCSETNVKPGDTKTFIKFFGGPYENEAYDVNTISDGYILAGKVQNVDANGEASDYDFQVIRTDKFGNQKWSVTLGDSLDDEARSVIQTSDGAFVAVGVYANSNTDHKMLAVKIDDNGSIIWSRQIGSINQFYGGNDISETHDGNLITAGYTRVNSTTSKNLQFFKLDPTGNVLEEYDEGDDNFEDEAFQIYEKTEGGLYIYIVAATIGSANTIIGGSATNGSQFGSIIIYSDNLNIGSIDVRAIGSGTETTQGYSVTNINDSVFYLSGTSSAFTPNFGGSDAYVAKFLRVSSSLSDSVWTVKYGVSSDDGAQDIIAIDNNLYIAGYRGPESMLIKTDLDGRTNIVDCNVGQSDITENDFCHLQATRSTSDDNLWFRTFGSVTQQMEGKINAVTSTEENGFIMAGSSRFASTTMMSLTKTNENGQVGE